MTLSKAIQDMQGMPDSEIAKATGEPLWKVREWRRAAGIPGFSGRFRPTSRREWLLHSAAGLVVEDDYAKLAVGG